MDFGSLLVGTQGRYQAVDVTNMGGSNTPALVGTSGPLGEFAIAEDGCTGKVLTPEESCEMDYTFEPTSGGPVTTVDRGTWNGQAFQIYLTGIGTNPLLISPTGLAFGNVPVGYSSPPQTVEVTNVSGSSQSLQGTEGSVGPFVFEPFDEFPRCDFATLGAGYASTCQMAYTFNPTAVGPVSATINGHWNAQTFQIKVTGTGIATAPAPAVTRAAPKSGPTAGGTTVTITGTGFTGATAVTFGAVRARSFTFVSASEIRAVSPAETAGVRNITVTTATGGTSPTVNADRFTYAAPAAVVKIIPKSGPTKGGTTVTITGVGLAGATRVMFGAVPAKRFRIVSGTEIIAVSPAQPAAVRNVRVTGILGGTSPAVVADRFTYR